MTAKISVVIPTRNRADYLERCLLGLVTQTLPPELYEISVVNNAGTDNTQDVVTRITQENPLYTIKLTDEPKAGVSRARNKGIQSSTAPLIAFIDDDGIAPPDWLEKFITQFETLSEDTAVISGEVVPIWPIARPAWITDTMLTSLSASSGLGPESRFLTEAEPIMQGNACYRRELLEAAGGFPNYLGRCGKNLLSGEGIVNVSIMAKGEKIFFDPSIKINHAIHPDQITPAWFRKQAFWQGVTNYGKKHYRKLMGLPEIKPAPLTLPLSVNDWQFINKDTTDNIEDSMKKFESLGYALAVSGVLPLDSE